LAIVLGAIVVVVTWARATDAFSVFAHLARIASIAADAAVVLVEQKIDASVGTAEIAVGAVAVIAVSWAQTTAVLAALVRAAGIAATAAVGELARQILAPTAPFGSVRHSRAPCIAITL
jgi:hypothetical protein